MASDLLIVRCPCGVTLFILDLDAPRHSRVRKAAIDAGFRDMGTGRTDQWVCRECIQKRRNDAE